MARKENTSAVLHDGEGTKSVILHLEQKLRMVERISLPERHWRELQHGSVLQDALKRHSEYGAKAMGLGAWMECSGTSARQY